MAAGSSAPLRLLPVMQLLLLSGSFDSVAAASLAFDAAIFAPGMVLQRGEGTKVWGSGAVPKEAVHVTVGGVKALSVATSTGDWLVTLPMLLATQSISVQATDGHTTTTLHDVAIGELLLCGGQSNMGYGMCGALSAKQTPAEAMATLAPVRYFFNHGSGPGGGSGTGPSQSNCNGVRYVTPNGTWFEPGGHANNNTGGASAICMLTASALWKHLGGTVPVGAVESCQSATNVQPW